MRIGPYFFDALVQRKSLIPFCKDIDRIVPLPRYIHPALFCWHSCSLQSLSPFIAALRTSEHLNVTTFLGGSGIGSPVWRFLPLLMHTKPSKSLSAFSSCPQFNSEPCGLPLPFWSLIVSGESLLQDQCAETYREWDANIT